MTTEKTNVIKLTHVNAAYENLDWHYWLINQTCITASLLQKLSVWAASDSKVVEI